MRRKAETRRPPSDRDLLVMFICLWRDDDGTPLIELEWAKQATDREIIDRFRALVHIDHSILQRALGGPDVGWNYYPRRRADHKKKTDEVDLSEIAKSKRIQKEHEDFRRKMLAKGGAIVQTGTDESDHRKLEKPRWPKRKVGYRLCDGTPVIPGRPHPRRRRPHE